MTDIIERLRAAVPTYEGVPIAWPCEVRSELLLEAAAEVERLRKKMLEVAEELESEEPRSHKNMAFGIRNALEVKP